MQPPTAKPWEVHTFLKSPVATLVGSIEDVAFDNISYHDITDAYNTFNIRLRTIAKDMVEHDGALPALSLVRRHAAAIAKCLRRDIRLILIDPFPATPVANAAIPNSLPSSTRETDEEMENARDFVSIGQAALHLTAYIFKFAVLGACFPHDDITALLDCVLEIALAPVLPTPSSQKTVALALWGLASSYRLEGPLSQRRHRLTRALGKAIVNSEATVPVIDGLKVVRNLLAALPSLFLDPFDALVPQILSCMTSPAAAVRTQAAHALSRFVLVPRSSTNGRTRKAVRDHLRTFLDHQLSSKPMHPSGTLRLGDFISAALDSEQSREIGQGAAWALVVLACIVVLSGSGIYSHPRTLKFVIISLQKTATNRGGVVRALHTSVWKCLVWAFASIGREKEFEEDANAAAKTRESAFLVVKQELGGGVGATLVSSLLSDYRPSRKPDDMQFIKALVVVKDMVKHPSVAIHREGVSILTRLIGSIGSSDPGSSSDTLLDFRILARDLFDGTILTSSWERLTALAPVFSKFDLENIRQLEETEIERRWEDLINIWAICVHRALSAPVPISPLSAELLHVWQALLLVQTQLTQERGHLTTPPEFSGRAVTIIDSFLATPKPVSSSSTEGGAAQHPRLILVVQLWNVMKNVFAASWLTPTARSILTSVLKHQYDLEREDVKLAWSELCAALIRANAPGLLSTLVVLDDQQGEAEIKRHLWSTLAETWSTSDAKPSWRDTVAFLVFPFGLWAMSDNDFTIWNEILAYAISQADSSFIVIETLILCIIENSGRLSAFPRATLMLVSRLRLGDIDDVSTTLLGHMDDFLVDVYSTEPEFAHLRLTMFPTFSTMFARCPSSKLASTIAALSTGLCIWINDKLSIFSDDGYNDIIMTFYRDTLDLLRGYTLTSDTLHALAPFLASAFVRLPPPALGPVAFKEFWDHIQPGLGSLEGALPKEIRTCLGAYHMAFGGVLPLAVSDSQSQPQPQSQSQSPSFDPTFGPQPPRAEEPCSPHWHRTRNFQDNIERSANTGFTSDPDLLADQTSLIPFQAQGILSPEWPSRAEYDSGSAVLSDRLRIPVSPVRSHGDALPADSGALNPSLSASVLSSPSAGIRVSPAGGVISRGKRPVEGSPDPRPSKRIRSDVLSKSSNSDNSSQAGSQDSVVDHTRVSAHASQERIRLSSLAASLSPAVPLPSHWKPHASPTALSPGSDDYVAWEAGLDMHELQRITRSRAGSPSGDGELQATDEGASSPQSAEPALLSADMLMMARSSQRPRHQAGDDTFLASAQSENGRVQTVPDRSQTAPASSSRPPAGGLQASPLRRAHTASARIDALRKAYDAVRADGSQMPVDEMLAATKLVHDIGGMLNKRLLKRFGDGGSDAGQPRD